jgi:hypothetical protein
VCNLNIFDMEKDRQYLAPTSRLPRRMFEIIQKLGYSPVRKPKALPNLLVGDG